MRKQVIYLSGNMTPDVQYYAQWTQDFNKYIINYDLPYECTFARPMTKLDGKYIVQHDLARLKKSDILVINIGVKYLKNHLTGSIVEVYEAWKQNIPVYSFCGEGLVSSEQSKSPWMDQFITEEFRSMNSMLNYLQFEEYLPGM